MNQMDKRLGFPTRLKPDFSTPSTWLSAQAGATLIFRGRMFRRAATNKSKFPSLLRRSFV